MWIAAYYVIFVIWGGLFYKEKEGKHPCFLKIDALLELTLYGVTLQFGSSTELITKKYIKF